MSEDEKIMVYAWTKCSSGVEKLSGQNFIILNKGTVSENDDSLFLGALIRIGNTEVEGAVKVISDDKQWKLWNSAYKSSVILVVSKDAKSEYFSFDYKPIRMFVPRIKREFVNRYNELLYNKPSICGDLLSNLSSFDIEHYTSQLVVERLKDKCDNIALIHKETNECWSDTALTALFDTMMISDRKMRSNFRQLARTIGYNSILKNLVFGNYEDDILNVEALFLGGAGFLNTRQQNCDDYTYALRQRFDVLQKRYNIVPMSAASWYSKTLSVPFQLAQLAAIVVATPTFYYKLVETNNVEEIATILKIELGEYWSKHTDLGVEGRTKSKTAFTKFKMDLMVINFVVPYLFFYNNISTIGYDDTKCEKLLDLLHNTDDEKQHLVTPWRKYLDINSAFRSQAMTQLSKKYCKAEACFKCRLGRKYLDKYDVF